MTLLQITDQKVACGSRWDCGNTAPWEGAYCVPCTDRFYGVLNSPLSAVGIDLGTADGLVRESRKS